MKSAWFFILLGLLVACSGGPQKSSREESATSGPAAPTPVGAVRLATPTVNPTESALLDVGLVVFDPGIPEDASTHSKLGIYPSIRRAEARYLPYVLREVLVGTESWGAVRVLPKPDEATELTVAGTILHSDGMRLTLHIRASDARGLVWLDKVYNDESLEADYPVRPGGEPYGDIYRQIANDLLAARETLSQDDLESIRTVALLEYATTLSPDAFADFVSPGADGILQVNRLPSRDDPMLQRVERIKNQEYLFIDTADEQYLTLYDQMTPTYNLWRQNGRELAIYKDEYEERVANRDRDGERGSFAAMQQSYNVYKRAKEHDQDLEEIAEGFNNEVAPTVMEVQGKVVRLNGSLEAQYNEWRRILRSIFTLETGLPPAS